MTRESGTEKPLADRRGSGSIIVLVDAGSDHRTQYFTAKKLAELWGETKFQPILEAVRGGKQIVVARTSERKLADDLIEQLTTTGARAWIADQQQLGGYDIF